MSDLIKSIPDGWKNEQGFVKKPSRLSPGQLVDLLEQALGQGLKWNCLTLEPEFESKLLSENIQNYFHIFLNQKGWTIGKADAQDALIFAAKKNSYQASIKRHEEEIAKRKNFIAELTEKINSITDESIVVKEGVFDNYNPDSTRGYL